MLYLFQTKKGTEDVKKSRPKPAAGGGLGLLPPPPGGVKLPPPGGAAIGTSQSQSVPQKSQQNEQFTGFNPTNNVSVGANNGGTSSNVDLLLDLGGDSFNSSQSATSQSQGQSATSQGQSSLFDSDFDLLSGTTDNVKPAGGSSDPWGDFTSAR